jgi:hypothetical protein
MPARSVFLVPIDLAQEIATVVWPRFIEYDGLVFVDLPGCRPGPGRVRLDPGNGMDRTGLEAFMSHIHVLDLFKHDRKVFKPRTLRYDRRHRHFRLAERLGQIVAEAWFAKLQCDFPQQHFRVYYTRDDNPIVRFHRVYAGEHVWMDNPEPRSSGQAVRAVWDTRRLLANKRLQPTRRVAGL